MGTTKLLSLESIRGLAALTVVWWHFASVFFPVLINGPAFQAHSPIDIWVYQTPLSIFLAGNFAVVLFFVLSGFVLTYRYMAHAQDSLFPAAMKRYARLMPVAAVSVIAAYFLLALGLMFAGQAGQASGSPWTGLYYQFDPAFLGAITQAFIGVFQSVVPANATYNPVLWTIYYELLGSLLVFGLASVARGRSKRWLLYGVAAVAFSSTYFAGFIIGLVVADLYATHKAWFERIGRMSWVYKWGLLLLAFVIGGYPALGASDGFGMFYTALTLFPHDTALSRTILQIVAAVILIVLALSWGRMARVLERKPLVWLGRVSYSLYATHFIVIYSLTSGLFLLFTQWWGYRLSALVALAVSVPVMLGIAALFQRFIEAPSIRLASRLGTWGKT